jgi:uncharacterized membrane protein
MAAVFKSIASYIAVAVEAGAALLILIGALEAFYKMISRFLRRQLIAGTRRDVRVEFGVWLLLGLEFELAADIIRTAISPSWNDIGQLAAIASIRTALNYFLELDIQRSGEPTARLEAPG